MLSLGLLILLLAGHLALAVRPVAYAAQSQVDDESNEQVKRSRQRCREDAFLELRATCEQHLDEIMRLYSKGDRAQSCARLRQYSNCVNRALNRTRCHRVAQIYQRERQRMRVNVNDYNWSCSMSRQEYAPDDCDGKQVINQHMKCGTTFQKFVATLNVYRDREQTCRAVRDYKRCVKPIFQNEDCRSNQDLMDKLLRFSHTVLNEYSSACKEAQRGHYQEAPATKQDDEEVSNFCRFEDLRQRTLQCQKEGYSIIRTRDAHSKSDICEELKVFRDCAVAALKGNHCGRDRSARQYVAGIVRESFSRYGIECTALWNDAARLAFTWVTYIGALCLLLL
ncbi:uncharacterized protein LOC135392686 [Ornithodoros turicata]|uniref:uncharacterized protein LOC135392686 n=1 Tax=Ornithodoros turicata TaxID=34597 RepID=UPI0031395501